MMPGQAHQGVRQQLWPTRVTGKIIDWKGKFGWIMPDQPVPHPESKKRGGRVFLNITDVEAEISGVGAPVSFFLYTDGTGLGAMNCRPSTGPPVQRPGFKMPQGPGSGGKVTHAAAVMQRQRISNAPVSGQIISWKGNVAWVKPLEPIHHPRFKDKLFLHINDIAGHEKAPAGSTITFQVYSDHQGLGAEEASVADGLAGAGLDDDKILEPTAKSATKPAGAKEKKASPHLPRERITEVPTTGEVIRWNKGYGWIKAHEAIDHPQAKPDGSLFVGQSDIQGAAKLDPGTIVQFHVFADSSGLGAEECSAF